MAFLRRAAAPPSDRPPGSTAPRESLFDPALLGEYAKLGESRFALSDPIGSGPNFLYDLLSPAWAEQNQFIAVDFDLISSFASKLRESLQRPGTIAEYDALVVRNSTEPRRKMRIRKMIIDAINGMPEAAGSLEPSLFNAEAARRAGHTVLLRPTEELIERIYANAFGWGPLERFINDRSITDLMVNAWDEIFIERLFRSQDSRILPAGVTFESPKVFEDWLSRLTGDMGEPVTRANPMIDFILSDGSRGNATMFVSRSPSLTIRRAQKQEVFTLERLVELGSITEAMAAWLRTVNLAGANLITYGETGSGKTTLLGALIDEKPEDKRLVIIEDTFEIFVDKVRHPNVVRMVVSEEATMRDLVKNALRQRPDHLIVGETRDRTAYDLLQALSVGTQGSMSTVHANGPRNALDRLSALILEAGVGITEHSVRQMVVEAVHVLVYAARLPDGRRCISAIDEVIGFEPNGSFLTEPVFSTSIERDADGHYFPIYAANPDFHMGENLAHLLRERGIDPDLWSGAAMAARMEAIE
jgi:pilus assembly protein CpaF